MTNIIFYYLSTSYLALFYLIYVIYILIVFYFSTGINNFYPFSINTNLLDILHYFLYNGF